MRVQVTDLSLTAVEEEHSVRWVVTSLADGSPVEKAHIEIDGGSQAKYRALSSGDTAADGHFTWDVPNESKTGRPSRIIVSKGDDVLVVDPDQALERYNAQGWFPQSGGWLGWGGAKPDWSPPAPR